MSKKKRSKAPSLAARHQPAAPVGKPKAPTKPARHDEEAPRKGRKRRALAASIVILVTVASMVITIVSPFIDR